MQPLIRPLPRQDLTEGEFYALGDTTLRNRIRAALRCFGWPWRKQRASQKIDQM
ncbi:MULTISPECIES: hypothetical protein [unclassified Yoonia]|uniref:hypothetical protein n=1 Tax=unclassified Yoonia TaxID=2629118 RepID=UPI002B000F76|nr:MULTISPECIES: hypothetical protein [unclassified Yoonia]